MAPHVDPYRTLGLTRGASLAEVKKAYRRLAKIHHPDAAGETALPKFLAIQAAYDQIVGPGAGSGPAGRPGGGSTAPRRPWDADPDRADATRRAYGGRGRRNRAGGGRSQAGTGTGGPRAGEPAGNPSGDAPPSDSAPGDSARGGSPGGGSPPPGTDGPARPPNKATLGSTSYDGADAEPFEPDWGGASWYGTTSGTYWTLNPKEYADPRKHGPEYQARARRAAARPDAPDQPTAASMASGPAAPDAPAGAASPPPTHTTSSWWQATAGPQPAASDEPGTERAEARDAGRGAEAPAASRTGGDPPHAPAGADGDSSSSGWAWLEGSEPSLGVRVGRAILGWLPMGLGVGWLGGELTGCGRFAADCDTSAGAMVWLVQVGLLALLLLVPALASLAATAAIAVIGVTIPTVLVLSAPGTGTPSQTGMTILLGVLLVAWVVGLGVGVVRAARRRPLPVS